MFTDPFSPCCRAYSKRCWMAILRKQEKNKIALEGKELKSMVLFLKVLYPPSMFEKSKAPLNDASRLSVRALADEYQSVNGKGA